jgi:hypothetical protein
MPLLASSDLLHQITSSEVIVCTREEYENMLIEDENKSTTTRLSESAEKSFQGAC